MRRSTFFAALLVLTLASSAFARPATGEKGMVATAHPAGSEAGVALLRAGGNAIDAAVGAAFALAVVEPYSSGLGGGGFALVRHEKALLFVDFREVAPKAATKDMYVVNGHADPLLSRDGPLAVAVPGAVAGYLALHERFGALPREKVLAPAISLAEKGFVVDSKYRTSTQWRLELLRHDPEAARIFLVQRDGKYELPPFGHRIVQRDLAATLRLLAKQGAKAFYEGAIAEKLVADMRARGGLLTRDDLRSFRVRDRAPLVGSYRGYAIATAPLPSAGGGVVLTILNLLETLPASTPWHEPEALHLYVEASKRAFADRALLGDPAFVEDPTPLLVDKARAKVLAERIGPRARPALSVLPAEGTSLETKHAPAASGEDGPDTTHLCTIDAAGNVVSMTTTVNYGWGAGIVARGTGIVWNDEMDDFAVAAGVPNAYGLVGSQANAVAPGKIPLSSMSPTIVFAGGAPSGKIRLVVGSQGGPRIPTTVAQVIDAHLAHGADVEQALTAGRLHHQHLPDTLFYEPFTLDAPTVRLLLARGHELQELPMGANATAIAVDPKTGLRSGAGDPRGVGVALAE